VLAALVPAYAIAVLMPAGPDDGCPSPRQVDDALAAHLPGMVLSLGHPTGPTTLRLAVTTDSSGAMRLDLTDPDGGPLLHRWLPAVDHARGGDCAALAETAALIVERYWHEVGYDVSPEGSRPPPDVPSAPPPVVGPGPIAATPPEAMRAAPNETTEPAAQSWPSRGPPAPLPPPRWWIAAGIGGRVGDAGTREEAAGIAFSVERALRRHRIGLRLSAEAEPSISYEITSPAASERVTLRQFPVRMGAYLALPVGFGQLEPGLGADLDVISAAVSRPSGSQTQFRAAPGIDAAIGWALRFRHDIYFRVLGETGTSVPYRFVTTADETPFFSTPRIYLDLGLELGFWFP
jgi:hypothetical protein